MRRFRPSSLALAFATGFLVAAAAQAQAPAARRIPPLADSIRQRVAAEVAVPSGFDMTLFAAPPHLTYPVCVEPGGPGVLFVCTDPNLNLDRERGRGRILRFVDEDGDGVADRYTIFADSLNAVRGLISDGETLYAMHAPTLSALRDTDGDGVADQEEILVQGLGFTLDDRGGDHTSNGITLGIDGWIYIAMGDYGFLGATGSDGTQLRMHGGGVVRVRPDGTELEIVARGTRNIYDLGIDPFLRIFARDNTNNGQAWNSRLHYLPTGVNAGYPSLFRNFPDEIHPSLADYGAGAATTALWIEDPAFPAELSSGLYTADWALNRIYRHPLTPRGATFDVAQTEFLSIPHPAHMELDPGSSLYVASLSGGSYTYAGEHVGYVVRIRPRGAPSAPDPPESVDESELISRIVSPSAVRRLEAERELLRRGSSPAGVRALERAIAGRGLPAAARVAALFTLKQLRGPESHPALLRAVAHPELRAMALRALADRRGELVDVPSGPFEQALSDADPFVRLQAATGLARLGSPGAAQQLLTAAVDSDAVVAHVARNALAKMGAVDVALGALDSGSEAGREAGLYVLGRVHSPVVVTALAARVESARDADRRRALLGTLARLYHREGVWNGEWWNNQPNTEGPYFDPVRWEESARIRPVLVRAVTASRGVETDSLVATFVREGVVPRESGELFRLLDGMSAESRDGLVDGLVGGRELSLGGFQLLAAASAGDGAIRTAVAHMLVAMPNPLAASDTMIQAVALDSAQPTELRAQALAALSRIPGQAATEHARIAHAVLVAELPGDPALMQAWRRFVGDRRRLGELDEFAAMAAGDDHSRRVLGYAVLVQIAGTVRNPDAARDRAAAAIDAAWADAAASEALVRAITLLGVEDRYAARLAAHRAGR